jgi:hypothetical protein
MRDGTSWCCLYNGAIYYIYGKIAKKLTWEKGKWLWSIGAKLNESQR